MSVKIFCGISGSGKSTYIKRSFPNAYVVSADYYFLNNEGGYKFDATKLSEAHGQCLRNFVTLCQRCENDVIVDNTNTSMMEIAPYAQLALAYGHDLEIVIIEADPVKAQERNTHGVPLQGVTNQHERLVKTAAGLPPWWPVKKVKMEE